MLNPNVKNRNEGNGRPTAVRIHPIKFLNLDFTGCEVILKPREPSLRAEKSFFESGLIGLNAAKALEHVILCLLIHE